MYTILLADDEGIMLESLKALILKNFPGECTVECVKTGRAAVEAAERLRPDIAFLDIQMPGLNGIQAMQEIRKYNDFTLFVIVTAFDRFSFAKEAINLGVIEYLTKPVNHRTFVDVLLRAMRMVDENRMKINDNLKVRERMAAVLPIFESGLIYSILLPEDFAGRADTYKELLDIREDYLQAVVIEWGDEERDGVLSNPIGAGVKAFEHETAFRDLLRQTFDAVTGPVMSNRMVSFVARTGDGGTVADRIVMIEKALHLIRRLKARVDLRFRVGIGSTQSFGDALVSYKEAIRSLRNCGRTVCHHDDICAVQDFDKVLCPAMEYVAKNFSREISAESVAEIVGISPYFFSRIFREKTGESFVEYITRVRMEAAARLLLDPVLSIKEVCASCGYIDPNYFGRLFRKQFGMLPEEYKEAKR